MKIYKWRSYVIYKIRKHSMSIGILYHLFIIQTQSWGRFEFKFKKGQSNTLRKILDLHYISSNICEIFQYILYFLAPKYLDYANPEKPMKE